LPKFAIVNLTTLNIHGCYSEVRNMQSAYACDLGNPSIFEHVAVVTTIADTWEGALEAKRTDDGTIKVVVNDAIFQEREAVEIDRAWESLRTKRNQLLEKSDWTQGNDSPLTALEKEAWAAYRIKLRFITDGIADPRTVVWPVL